MSNNYLETEMKEIASHAILSKHQREVVRNSLIRFGLAAAHDSSIQKELIDAKMGEDVKVNTRAQEIQEKVDDYVRSNGPLSEHEIWEYKKDLEDDMCEGIHSSQR